MKEYRNIFHELGFSQEEIDHRLRQIVHTFFYDETEKVFHAVSEDMAYIEDTGNTDARTEGMSYGMMMCVQLDMQKEFDQIWKWTKTYMYQTSGPYKGYFAWSCALDGRKNAEGPAPDGEEFFAMALFFASHRWGDRDGIFNYSHEAKELLKTCIHNPELNPHGRPMWNSKNYQILFTPGSPFTDPSYHLPHFYTLFAQWAYEEDRDFWLKAVDASRTLLAATCHPVTGLNPNLSEFDGSPLKKIFRWGRADFFYSDAYRTAANIGLDYEWNHIDCGQRAAVERQQYFLGVTKKDNPFQCYELDGREIKNPSIMHPVGLLATTAQASLAIPDSFSQENLSEAAQLAKEWVLRFWNEPMKTGQRRYYDNCLYLFAFLALSGKYRIW